MREKERDMRSREVPLPKPKLEYSHPVPVAHESKDHNENLSWWQKLNNTQINLFGGAKAEVRQDSAKPQYHSLPKDQAAKDLSVSESVSKNSWWKNLWSKKNKSATGIMKREISQPVKSNSIMETNNQATAKPVMPTPIAPKNFTQVPPQEPIKPVVQEVKIPAKPVDVQVRTEVTSIPVAQKVEMPKITETKVEKIASPFNKIGSAASNQAGKMNSVSATQNTKAGTPTLANKTLPDVNLIPSEQRFVSLLSLYVILIASFMVGVLVVAGAYYGLSAYRDKILNQAMSDQKVLITEQDNLEKEITKSEMSLAVKMRLDSFTEVIKRHLGWNEVFSLIENNTLTTVGWTTFAGDAGGKVSLSGEAPNYTAVAKQLKALQSLPSVQGVSLTGLGQKRDNSNIITFQLVVTLKPEIFISAK